MQIHADYFFDKKYDVINIATPLVPASISVTWEMIRSCVCRVDHGQITRLFDQDHFANRIDRMVPINRLVRLRTRNF